MIQCPEVTAERTGPVFKASVLLPAPVLLSMPRATSVGILFLAPSVSLVSILGWSRASVRHSHAVGNSLYWCDICPHYRLKEESGCLHFSWCLVDTQ